MLVALFEGCKAGGKAVTNGDVAVVVAKLVFKLLSMVLVDLSNSCCRLGGGWLMGDGTGVPLDEGGFCIFKGGGLNTMVDGKNLC